MTTINFTLPQAADVRLAVYNVRGQLVQTLVDGPRAAGPHAVDWSGKDLSSGVYLYLLDVDGMRTIKRMTLVK